MEIKKIKKITIELSKIGDDKDWFLIVDEEDCQERGWLIGKKEEVDEIIKLLRKL